MRIAKMRAVTKFDQLIVILLAAALCGTAPGFGQQAGAQTRVSTTTSGLPDAPEPIAKSSADAAANEKSEIALSPSAQQPPQTGTSEAANSGQQQSSPKPVGTAAAPPEGAAGITASRPAGAVIAPAKQRRARAIFIRVGLLVGAGVALGTVLALTRATPNQPPK